MPHHLHQLRVKLVNIIATNYTFNPQNPTQPKEVEEQLASAIDEIYDALGGCEICAGRGYIIETNKLCDCKRGIALKNYIENYEVS